MEAKHTPEPWKVVEHHGVIDVMGAGSGVCRVFTDPNQDSLPTMPQARANARLIAAAPDLLRALSAIVENTDKGYSVTTWTGLDGIADAGSVANLDAARAAIARATGGGK